MCLGRFYDSSLWCWWLCLCHNYFLSESEVSKANQENAYQGNLYWFPLFCFRNLKIFPLPLIWSVSLKPQYGLKLFLSLIFVLSLLFLTYFKCYLKKKLCWQKQVLSTIIYITICESFILMLTHLFSSDQYILSILQKEIRIKSDFISNH